MNLNETKQAIGIAKQQAAISEDKMNYWKKHGAEWKATMYSIRMKALRCYANELDKNIRNYNRRQIKRNNNN